MENEDNLTETVLKTRRVLTDVTNLPSKRPYSLISGDDGVDNLAKKKCQLQFGNIDNNDMLQSKGENPSLPQDISHQEQHIQSGASEEQNVRVLVDEGFARPPDDEEGFVEHAIETDERDIYVLEDLGPPKCATVSMEPPTLPPPGVPKFLGLERCAGLKGQGGANSSLVDQARHALKFCPCSFCTKAGYIFSDLLYQDVKSRLSVARKSQKEANMLLRKVSGIIDSDNILHNQQDCADPSNLESTLLHQHKSLFAFMENKYAQDASHFESELQKLKDVKDQCKNDLPLTDNSNHDKN